MAITYMLSIYTG